MGFTGFAGVSENINKQGSLGMVDGASTAESGYTDIKADIDQHAPENRVGNAVKVL